jgi:hypothetical protein
MRNALAAVVAALFCTGTASADVIGYFRQFCLGYPADFAGMDRALKAAGFEKMGADIQAVARRRDPARFANIERIESYGGRVSSRTYGVALIIETNAGGRMLKCSVTGGQDSYAAESKQVMDAFGVGIPVKTKMLWGPKQIPSLPAAYNQVQMEETLHNRVLLSAYGPAPN